MATRIIPGQTTWHMTRDSEGHRDYTVKFRVLANRLDGPARVLLTPGLPLPGAFWLIDNDIDIWAWCLWDTTVTPDIENEPNRHWTVEHKFSTKPPNLRNCKDNQVEDPLLEPMKISGTFVKYTEEAIFDRAGRPIVTSSHEQLRGQQNEWDANRPQVKIEQNVPTLELELFAPMVDTVNDDTLWGLPRRTIKLSNVSWERKFHGSCEVYYTRNLEFDIRYETFDRDILDEGTKVLHGHWDLSPGIGTASQQGWVIDDVNGNPPNPANPQHFIRFKDRQGENARVILDGHGRPYDPGAPPDPGFYDTGINQGSPTYPPTTTVSDLNPPTGVVAVTQPGGQLAGNFEYFVTAVGNKGETLPSSGVTASGVPSGHQVHLTWAPSVQPPKPGFLAGPEILSYRIYRRGPEVFPTPLATMDRNLIATVGRRVSGPGNIHVERYNEANFLLLGIPLIL